MRVTVLAGVQRVWCGCVGVDKVCMLTNVKEAADSYVIGRPCLLLSVVLVGTVLQRP